MVPSSTASAKIESNLEIHIIFAKKSFEFSVNRQFNGAVTIGPIALEFNKFNYSQFTA